GRALCHHKSKARRGRGGGRVYPQLVEAFVNRIERAQHARLSSLSGATKVAVKLRLGALHVRKPAEQADPLLVQDSQVEVAVIRAPDDLQRRLTARGV